MQLDDANPCSQRYMVASRNATNDCSDLNVALHYCLTKMIGVKCFAGSVSISCRMRQCETSDLRPYSKDTPSNPPYRFTLPSIMDNFYEPRAALITPSQDQCAYDSAVLQSLEGLIIRFCG